MVEQAVTADDICLSSLIEQPLERRTTDGLDDGPSHRWRRRRVQQPDERPPYVHLPTTDRNYLWFVRAVVDDFIFCALL